MNTAAQIIQTQPASMATQPKGTLGDWAKNGGFKKGSDINYAQLATGAVGLMGETMNNLRNNTDAKSAKAFNVNAGSFDELGSQFESYKPLDFGWEHPFFEGLKGSIQSGASGAAAGSAAGPIGTLIGGIVGTALGGFSGTFGALKRNRQGEDAESRLNPLSQNRFEGAASSLREDSISNSLINYAAMGGQLSTNGGNFPNILTEFNSGGNHEQNPNGGIMQGMGANGKPNTVEEGETRMGDFVFTNRLNAHPEITKQFNLPTVKGTYADASKKIAKVSKERPNDPIEQRGVKAMLGRLSNAQEVHKQQNESEMEINQEISNAGLTNISAYGGNIYSNGGKMNMRDFFNKINTTNQLRRGGPIGEEAGSAAFPRFDLLPQVNHNIAGQAVVQNPFDPIKGSNIPQESTSQNEGFDFNQIGMMAPAISNGIQLMSAISSKPDVLSLQRVKAGTRLSEDFRYNPMDREYIANKLRAESGATRKGIMNTSGGNRATATAGLLSADKNFLTGLGDAYFKADEMNQNKLMQIAQMRNQARQANASIGLQEGQINSGIATTEFDYNARARAARSNAIREGLASLAGNMSDMSRYQDSAETVENMYGMYTRKGKYKGNNKK